MSCFKNTNYSYFTGLALTPKIVTSQFNRMQKDELAIEKELRPAIDPDVNAVHNLIDTDKSRGITSVELKTGAGMNAEIEKAFEHPVLKVAEVNFKSETKRKAETVTGGAIKRKKFQGGGLKYV